MLGSDAMSVLTYLLLNCCLEQSQLELVVILIHVINQFFKQESFFFNVNGEGGTAVNGGKLGVNGFNLTVQAESTSELTPELTPRKKHRNRFGMVQKFLNFLSCYF